MRQKETHPKKDIRAMRVKIMAATMKPHLYLCTKSSNVFFWSSLRFVSALSRLFVSMTVDSSIICSGAKFGVQMQTHDIR